MVRPFADAHGVIRNAVPPSVVPNGQICGLKVPDVEVEMAACIIVMDGEHSILVEGWHVAVCIIEAEVPIVHACVQAGVMCIRIEDVHAVGPFGLVRTTVVRPGARQDVQMCAGAWIVVPSAGTAIGTAVG